MTKNTMEPIRLLLQLKVAQTFMIRSPSWTPALTAAPPVEANTDIH